jgi:hypothetical protein
MDDHEVEEEERFRVRSMVRYQAFLFVTHREGWRQFCRERPLEPEALLQIKPGWDMVTRTEGPAREHAYSPEEAALFLLSQTPLPEEPAEEDFDLPQVVTVTELAQVWRALIDLQVTEHLSKGKR